MGIFTDKELDYMLGERRLGRLATIGPDGMPHVAPVGWGYDPVLEAIEIGGHHFETTKKFRDVRRTGRAAIVIDDVLPPWQPRGVEIRGRAEAVEEPTPLIRIHPDRVVSWGLESDAEGRHSSPRVHRSTS